MLNHGKTVCVGGANVDIKAKGISPLVLKSSNPVRSFTGFGGVARNIAENLSRLGVPVQLISRVGLDYQGDSILTALKNAQIETTTVSRSEFLPTATYTALLEPGGEMWVALADMEIYEELTPEVLRLQLDLIHNAGLLVLDTNLSESSLKYLVSAASSRSQIWVVPVSVPKVARLRNILPDLDGLILNTQELSELCEKPLNDLPSLKAVCHGLLEKGLGAVIVTRGEKGVFLACSEKFISFQVNKKPLSADVTGAGDSLAAGVFFGLQRGLGFVESVKFGIAAAEFSLQTEETVSPVLNLATLETKMKSLFCEIKEI